MSSHLSQREPVFRDMRHAKDCERPNAAMADVGKEHQPRWNAHKMRGQFFSTYGRLLALRLEYIFLPIFQ
jgi:hypothetical protein